MPKTAIEPFSCTLEEVITFACNLPLIVDTFACRKRLGESLTGLACPVEQAPVEGKNKDYLFYLLWVEAVQVSARQHIFDQTIRQYPAADLLDELIDELPKEIPHYLFAETVKTLRHKAAEMGIQLDFPLDMPPLPARSRKQVANDYINQDFRFACLERWGWKVQVAVAT